MPSRTYRQHWAARGLYKNLAQIVTVARLPEVEQHLQLGPAVATRAAGLLGTDHFAADRLKDSALDAEVVVEGADAGIAVEEHANGALRLAKV